jgi:hypothetical protein
MGSSARLLAGATGLDRFQCGVVTVPFELDRVLVIRRSVAARTACELQVPVRIGKIRFRDAFGPAASLQ